MRLDELHGVKKYKNRTLYDVIGELSNSGMFWGSGRFSTVIGHRNWNYVYKVFKHDWAYMAFVEYVLKNPNPAFPKIYGAPRLITPFYKRPREEDQVYIVKMEKLVHFTSPDDADSLASLIEYSGNMIPYLLNPDDPDLAEKRTRYYELRDHRQEILRQEALGKLDLSLSDRRALMSKITEQIAALYPYPSLEDYDRALKSKPSLMNVILAWDEACKHVKASPDLHGQNIMIRPRSFDVVLTDPFWHGSNPYMDYDEFVKRETDALGDDEPEYVRGGERYKKPEPQPWSPPENDGDIPF